MRVNSIFAVKPPITMIASGCCICAPGPMRWYINPSRRLCDSTSSPKAATTIQSAI